MEFSSERLTKLTRSMALLALQAGEKAMEIYQSDFTADSKADASLVTDADRLGEEIILNGLSELAPDIPVLAEEAASDGNIPDIGETFFLVDPLDGTKEFVNKTGEFTVNIALVHKGSPVAGVVFAPAISKLYTGVVGSGASLQMVDAAFSAADAKPIHARPVPQEKPVAIASRSHRSPETEEYLKSQGVTDFISAGSSLKFCLVAEGKADIYPRFGRTMEWDTGAGQAVLAAAGGSVETHPEAAPLTYGKEERGFDNPYFIAWGRRC